MTPRERLATVEMALGDARADDRVVGGGGGDIGGARTPRRRRVVARSWRMRCAPRGSGRHLTSHEPRDGSPGAAVMALYAACELHMLTDQSRDSKYRGVCRRLSGISPRLENRGGTRGTAAAAAEEYREGKDLLAPGGKGVRGALLEGAGRRDGGRRETRRRAMKKPFVVANRPGSEPKDASRLVRVVVRVGILTDVSRFQSCRAHEHADHRGFSKTLAPTLSRSVALDVAVDLPRNCSSRRTRWRRT